jgi:hypothetical protein
MPLRYKAAETAIPGFTASISQTFDNWTNKFVDKGVARAVGEGDRVLAEIRPLEFDNASHSGRFRETHFSPTGQPTFSCVSLFEAHAGYLAKVSESDTSGHKQMEYFFVLPETSLSW